MKFWQSRYSCIHTLSQQALIDISQEISQKYALRCNSYLPELAIMPVDPLHLYAWWNLQNQADTPADYNEPIWILRIYSLPDLSESEHPIQLQFDVKVTGLKNQHKIPLPVSAMAYAAIIGKQDRNGEITAVAQSNIIQVPRDNPVSVSEWQGICPNPQQRWQERINTSGLNNASRTLVLENFNAYGYDLVIFSYEQDLTEVSRLLCRENSDPPLRLIKSPRINKNDSGQGFGF